MTAKPTHRAWVATYQWPGKEPFRFGTAFARLGAPQNEVEAELEAEFRRMFGEILPDRCPLPELKDLTPGSLVFIPEERSAAMPGVRTRASLEVLHVLRRMVIRAGEDGR